MSLTPRIALISIGVPFPGGIFHRGRYGEEL
jgi:hypothetical protein